MKTLFRCLTALLLLSEAPFVAQAEPFVITQGSFGIGRGLIGLDKGAAELLWFNPPPGAFESSERKRIDLLAASWSPDLYESTLLGGTTVVLPLHPGPVPVGGTFSGDKGASFFFQGDGPDVSPFLESSISLTLSGGTFLIPTEFPPTDDEGLYILEQPFRMTGTWTVNERGAMLFRGDLVGSGQASLILGADQRTGNSIISSVTYNFETTSAVPEPATLVLLALGAAGAFARRQKSGRSAAP